MNTQFSAKTFQITNFSWKISSLLTFRLIKSKTSLKATSHEIRQNRENRRSAARGDSRSKNVSRSYNAIWMALTEPRAYVYLRVTDTRDETHPDILPLCLYTRQSKSKARRRPIG